MSDFSRRPPAGLIYLALLIPTAPNWVLWGITNQHGYWLLQCLTGALLAASPLLFNWPVRLSLLLGLPFALFAPFVAAYVWATGYSPSLLALQILREATGEEFSNFLPQLLLGSLVSAAIGGFYLYLWSRSRGLRVPLPPAVRWMALLMMAALLGKDVARSGPGQGGRILLARLERMSPLAPLVLMIHLKQQGWIVPDRRSALSIAVTPPGPTISPQAVCILIVGESARRDAFGLYQSGLATTPLLGKRDLVVFRDAISSGTATIQAVPILVTGQFPEGAEMLPYRAIGAVEAFRLAGFHTAWMSTQQADGEIDSFITAFSTNAQEKVFYNGRLELSGLKEDVAAKLDGAMLPDVERILGTNPGRVFILLHTLGSHAPYTKRYPVEFEKWPIAAAARTAMYHWLPPFSAAQQVQLNNAYFNDAYYTDWFCDQVIAAAARRGGQSAVIFLSDHGDNPPDAPVMPAAHAVLSDAVVNVPFWIWLSPELKDARPAQAAALLANARKAVSAEDLFSTLCGLYDIHTRTADPAKDLAAPTYREHPRRILTLDGRVVTIPAGVDGIAHGR